MYDHDHDHDFHYASDTDWDRAEASELGALHPERAWVLTDRDVWHKNPYYTGPAVRHPEDDDYEDTGLATPAVDLLDDIPF